VTSARGVLVAWEAMAEPPPLLLEAGPGSLILGGVGGGYTGSQMCGNCKQGYHMGGMLGTGDQVWKLKGSERV
jgi:hypothetical protein